MHGLRTDAVRLGVGLVVASFGAVVAMTGLFGRPEAALLRVVTTPSGPGGALARTADLVAYLAVPACVLVSLWFGRRRLAGSFLGVGVATWATVHLLVAPIVAAVTGGDGAAVRYPSGGVALVAALATIGGREGELPTRIGAWAGVAVIALMRLRAAADLPSGVVGAIGLGVAVAAGYRLLVEDAQRAPGGSRTSVT